MIKPVRSITFTSQKYPEIIAIVNRLANLLDRKPHDTAKRLLLECGQRQINEIEAQIEFKSQPA